MNKSNVVAAPLPVAQTCGELRMPDGRHPACSTIGRRNLRPSLRSNGFVLVLVVVMVAVVTLMVAQMANASLLLTRRAVEEERIVRHRWAVSSLRFSLLGRGRGIQLAPSDGRQQKGAPEMIRLNATHYRVLVSSESSKLPLARLAAVRPRQEVRELVRELNRAEPGLLVRPEFGAQDREVQHWDAVFWNRDILDPQWPVRLRRATHSLSLWNDRLDIVRAGDEEVDRLWKSLIGHLPDPDFHTYRRAAAGREVRDILDVAGLTEAKRRELESWFTNRSEQVSLWIHARGPAIHDDYLFVRGTQDTALPVRAGFVW